MAQPIMPEQDDGFPYRVWAFFPDGTHTLIDDNLDAREAVECAKRQTTSVGAKIGTTCRVIIEDALGHTCFQWENGRVTYPTVEMLQGAQP